LANHRVSNDEKLRNKTAPFLFHREGLTADDVAETRLGLLSPVEHELPVHPLHQPAEAGASSASSRSSSSSNSRGNFLRPLAALHGLELPSDSHMAAREVDTLPASYDLREKYPHCASVSVR
jgi:hypothetical protein